MGEVRKLGVLSTQRLAIIDAVISLLETAQEHENRYDSSLTQAIEQTVLPVFTALGPHWAGRDRYRDWYLLRGQFLPSFAIITGPVSSLVARIGAALLADSRKFRELLQTQAILSPAGPSGGPRCRRWPLVGATTPTPSPLLRDRDAQDR